MRSRRTLAVVAAVIALGAAAGFDALRSGGEAAEPTTSATEPVQPSRPSAPERLADRGITGILHATIRRVRGCRFQQLLLPNLERASSVAAPTCPFAVSHRRGRFTSATYIPRFRADRQALAASPDGRWIASTTGATVQVYRAGVRRPLDPVEIELDAVDLGWGG